MNQPIYNKIYNHTKELAVWQSILALLEWDQETYMPSDGIHLRSDQKQLIATLLHQKKKEPSYIEALSQLIDLKTGEILQKNLDEETKAALRAWRQDVHVALALPDELIHELTKLTSQAAHVWAKARANNDFASFAPYLKKIVDLHRKKAHHLSYKEHPYDALLDLYEPGMSVKVLDDLFATLKAEITPLVRSLSPSKKILDLETPDGETQRTLCLDILKAIGIDFNRGRLDTTAHPFCMALSPQDLRLTTHTGCTNIINNVLTTLHEGGHGLYEQGLPIDHFGTPLAETASLGIHESQSRFWETRIGLSLPFWRYYYPTLQERFPSQFNGVSLETFYTAITQAEASLIRVRADELSYSLHIIVRYELEKALIEGSLEVEELPKAFNQKMEDYLGIVPPSDKEGVLQDIHWAAGLIGYFPTYALGNIYAAQLFAAFENCFPDWAQKVASGELLFIRDWLCETIFKHGRRYLPQELIQRATGEPLNPAPYCQYLRKKFGAQCGLTQNRSDYGLSVS